MSPICDENSQLPAVVVNEPNAPEQEDIVLIDGEPMPVEIVNRLPVGENGVVQPAEPILFILADCCSTFHSLAIMFDCETPVQYDEEHKRYVFEHEDKPLLIYVSEEEHNFILVDGSVKEWGQVKSIEPVFVNKRYGIDHFCMALHTFIACFFLYN